MNRWRYYVGLGLFGAVVSLISGIAGGNPFGVILLRMLLSALLFAGFGLGAGIMLRKYLPELLQQAAGVEEAPAEPAVDILIPEENPHRRPDAADAEEAADAEPLEELDEEAVPAAETQDAGVEPEAPAAAVEAADEEETEEAEEAIPLEEELSAEGSGEIDSLPDLDQFDSSNYVGPDISGLKSGREDFTQAQVDGIMSREDPAQLAKAVRTFLKKDQEG